MEKGTEKKVAKSMEQLSFNGSSQNLMHEISLILSGIFAIAAREAEIYAKVLSPHSRYTSA